MPPITSQNLNKSGENKDSGPEEKTICHVKILHSTEETRDELREWEHVPSKEKMVGSTVEPISPEMASQSNSLTGKSLLIHMDPVDS